MAVVCWSVCSCEEQDVTDYGILRAVPNDAGVIVMASDVSELCAVLNNYNMIWEQMRQMPRLKSASDNLKTIDAFIKKNNTLHSLFQGKKTVVSFHREGKDNVVPLLCVAFNKQEHFGVGRQIIEEVKRRKLRLGSDVYEKDSIYYVSTGGKENGKIHLAMAYVRGVFLASTSSLTIELAIRHIRSKDNKENSITQESSLRPLLDKAGKNVTALLMFNYSKLCLMLGGDISRSAQKFAKHAQWSVFDISIDKHYVSFAGNTSSTKAEQLLSILQSQKRVPIDCSDYMPYKTTSFVTLGISDMHLFANDYANHLKARNVHADYVANNERIRKSYGVDFSRILYGNISGTITEFSCTYSLAGRPNDHYIVAELNDADDFLNQVLPLCKKYRQINNISDKNGIFSFNTSSGKSYTAYQFPVKHAFSSYFGSVFATESEYMMIYNDRAVFAQNKEALYEYANNIDNGKVLSKNQIYKEFKDYVSSECNLYYYVDISYAQEEFGQWLTKANADELIKNSSCIQNIRSFSLQYACSDEPGDPYYTHASVIHSTDTEDERKVSWLVQTDTTICTRPTIVINHQDKTKEVLVQDETNKLYLFNSAGKKQFVKQIGEPIVGPITQIDYYGNNKLQYLFATEHSLHVIARNGDYVENYPITLPAMVSSDIAVYDYDSTGDYRIFVPCSDRRLYVYTKDGKPLDAWTPFVTNEPIQTPVQHLRSGDNEYLIFADNLKTYILNRRGEVRICVSNTFPKAKNSIYYLENAGTPDMRFVTSNSSGEIKYIYSDGSCKSKKFNSFTANHYFVLRDIDGDGSNDYIFTDGDMLYVYNADGREKFSRCFDGTVGRPSVYKFSDKDVRIGVVCKSDHKLYLLDNKGEICRGFPLYGATEFPIVKFNSNSRFSLLAGGADNYLYNYWLY